MLIKICGITNAKHGNAALCAGADWIGLNLVGGPRRLTVEQAASILDNLVDAPRAVVLVSVDQGSVHASLLRSLGERGVLRLQLYGDVLPETINQLQGKGFQTIYVQPVCELDSIVHLNRFLDSCTSARPTYVLLDAYDERRLGGTGRNAHWGVIQQARREERLSGWPPQLLAGGLKPGNVSEAVRRIDPAGVDVSSGVETSPGLKDPAKIAAFIAAVRNAAGRS